MYLRVSSIGQAEDGTSLDSQSTGSRDYCDRQGYAVRRIYREVESAKDGARPVFQHMLDVARRGGFDVLVVWRRDRFFRNAVEAGFYERMLRQWGVRVEDVQRGQQKDSAATRFTTTIIDAFAELERENIAERCALGRLSKAKAGRWPTKALYGYLLFQGRLDIRLEEATRMREAYRECIRGANRWRLGLLLGIHGSTAIRRLQNPAYKGLAMYAGVNVPCPPIVEESTWQAAQEAIAGRFRNCDQDGRIKRRGELPATRSTSGSAP